MKNKNEIKEIITEAVIGFLNEARRWGDQEDEGKKKKIFPTGSHPEEPQDIPITHKNPWVGEKPTGALSPWINKKKKLQFPPYPKQNTGLGDFQPNPPGLNETQKKEIEEIIRKTLTREGVLGWTFGTNVDEDKTSFGVRVDPTARGNWIYSKEESLYEMPLKYNNSLHEFVKATKKRLMENK